MPAGPTGIKDSSAEFLFKTRPAASRMGYKRKLGGSRLRIQEAGKNRMTTKELITGSVAELGPLTGSGSGILNMAIVGGAILPVAQGAIADRVGLHHAFLLPVICYLFILLYGLSGSKPNSLRRARA